MEPREAAESRSLRVKNPITDAITQYDGRQVYSVCPLGVVTVVGQTSINILHPWHTVVDFTYHHMDEKVRKVIQGW